MAIYPPIVLQGNTPAVADDVNTIVNDIYYELNHLGGRGNYSARSITGDKISTYTITASNVDGSIVTEQNGAYANLEDYPSVRGLEFAIDGNTITWSDFTVSIKGLTKYGMTSNYVLSDTSKIYSFYVDVIRDSNVVEPGVLPGDELEIIDDRWYLYSIKYDGEWKATAAFQSPIIHGALIQAGTITSESLTTDFVYTKNLIIGDIVVDGSGNYVSGSGLYADTNGRVVANNIELVGFSGGNSTGSSGDNGISQLAIYCRSDSVPALPAESVVTPDGTVIIGSNTDNWQSNWPVGAGALYIATATVIIPQSGNTEITWSGPERISGLNSTSAYVSLQIYCRSQNMPTLPADSTLNYEGVLQISAYDTIWSTAIPDYDDDTTNEVYWCYPYHLMLQNYNSYQAKSRQTSAVRVGRTSADKVVIAAFTESAELPGENGIVTIRVNPDLSISAVDGRVWTTYQPDQSIDPLWIAIFPAIDIDTVVNSGTNGILLQSQYLWQVDGLSVVNELALDTEYIDHSNDPTWYPIGSLAQFQSYFGTPTARININNTKNFYLTADIDFAGQSYTNSPIANSSGTDYWSSLFQSSDVPFSGQFDGQGYSIQNLTISRPDSDKQKLYGFRGLFGAVRDGVISNLRMTNCSIHADGYTGGLIGALLKGSVNNCGFSGQISLSGVYEDHIRCVGGLIGNCSDGSYAAYTAGLANVTNSYASGSITYSADLNSLLTPVPRLELIGGLVGYAAGTTNLHNCYTDDMLISLITAMRYIKDIGGITGYNHGNGTIMATNSNTTISINNNYTNVQPENIGGFFGYNGGSISRSRSQAVINIDDRYGDSPYNQVGGFGGVNYGTISDCYSLATIVYSLTNTNTPSTSDAGINIAGFIGGSNNANIYRCYSMPSISYSSDQYPNRRPYIFGASMYSNLIFHKCFSLEHPVYPGYRYYGAGETNEIIEADMYDPATFIAAGWDFAGETANGTADIWSIVYSGTSPILDWEKEFLAPYCKIFWDNSLSSGAVNPDLIIDLDDNIITSDPAGWDPGAEHDTLPITTYEVNGGRIWMACSYLRVPNAYDSSDITWQGPIRLETLDGSDGPAGPVGPRVQLWYNRSDSATVSPTLPTTASYNGWKTSLGEITATGKYIWTIASYVDSDGVLLGFDDSSICMSGIGGDTTVFRFMASESVPDVSGLAGDLDLSGVGWYPQPPVIPSGSILWMIQADFSGVGQMISAGWSQPIPLTARDNIVAMYADSDYATDNPAWHETFNPASDKWMMISYDGGINWHGPFKIVGDSGAAGIGVAGPAGISTLFVYTAGDIPLWLATAEGTILINSSDGVLTSSDGYTFGSGSVFKRTSSGWVNQGTLHASAVWAGSLITDAIYVGQDGSGNNDITIYGWDGQASTVDKSSYYTWGDIATALAIDGSGNVTIDDSSLAGGGFFGRLRYDGSVYRDVFVVGNSDNYFGVAGNEFIRKGQFVGEGNIADGAVNEVYDDSIGADNEIELSTSPKLYLLDEIARSGSFLTMFNFSLRTYVKSYWRTLLSFVTADSLVADYPSAVTTYPAGYLTFLKSDGWFYIRFGSTTTDIDLVSELSDNDVQVFTITVGDQTYMFDMETVNVVSDVRKIYTKNNAQGYKQTYVRFQAGQGFAFDGQTINGNLRVTTYKNIVRAKTNNCRVFVPDEASIPPVFDQDKIVNPVKTLFSVWLQSTRSAEDNVFGKLRYNYRLWKIKK